MVSRRLVIFGGVAAAGGLAVGYALMPYSTAERAKGMLAKTGSTPLSAWVRIGTDNSVTVIVPHSEMGQGVHTSMPMMLAEELDADWALVRMEQAPADMAFANGALAREYLRGDMSIPSWMSGVAEFGARKTAEFMNLQITGGSTAVRMTGVRGMRMAGATARWMLIKAAATAWGVPESEVTAKQSKLSHASGKTATYGEMAAAAAAFDPPVDLPLKAKKDYTIVGQPVARFDIPGKVDGSAKYGIDLRLPNISYAVIAASPVFGGTLKSVDEKPAMAMRGVKKVVKLPAAVAVVADNTWRAKEALAALLPVWDEGKNANVNQASIFAAKEAALAKVADLSEDHATGDVDAALKGAKKVIEATYRVPFLAHATMEVMNCTAHFDGDKLTVWGGFQDGLGAKARAAKAAGIPIDNVTLHHTAMGGGFGRRGYSLDYLDKAVTVARQVEGPVQVVFSREEDMTQDFYRHASLAKMKAALDDNGKVTAWLHTFTEKHDPPEAIRVNYDFANQAARYASNTNPIPWGPWRSVDHTQQGFFIETFMDELAVAAGKDPFEFRRAHLSGAPRHKAALELAAEMANWSTPPEAGRARGIAIRDAFGTIVAQVAEVSVGADGRARVHKMWSAVDPGEVINPATFTAQIQGGAIYGLTAALYGEISIDKGRVVQQNFPDYEMVRMADAPEHEVRFIESGARTGGAGEPGTAPVAAAVGNAIYALTKKRVRELPFMKTTLTASTAAGAANG
jgi:isoquinoline 1-oxidoreductase beta subunit